MKPIISVGKHMEKREPQCTVSENVIWCTHYGEQYGDSTKKVKKRTAIRASTSNPGYLSNENENTNQKRYVHPMFITGLFTVPKIWKQTTCPIDE